MLQSARNQRLVWGKAMAVLSTTRRFGWCIVDKPDVALFRCANCCGRNRPFPLHPECPQAVCGACSKNCAFACEHNKHHCDGTAVGRLWSWPSSVILRLLLVSGLEVLFSLLYPALEQTLQRSSHSPIGESRGATCGTLNGKPILGTLFGARRDVVGDRPV